MENVKVDEGAIVRVQKDWHDQHGVWKDLTIRSIIEAYEKHKQQTNTEINNLNWRIAKNKYNLENPPWKDAVAIEEYDDGVNVPGIICWVTRGGDQDARASLIAAAPKMLKTLKRVKDDWKFGDYTEETHKAVCDAIQSTDR